MSLMAQKTTINCHHRPDDPITVVLDVRAIEGDGITEVVLRDDVRGGNKECIIREHLPCAHARAIASLARAT